MNIVISLFRILSLLIIIMGSLTLLYFPLALIASLKRRPPPVFESSKPLVSIIVPAYNEEKVIANCVESILASDYTNLEIILVDDGSKDETFAVMKRYHNPPGVIALTKPNGGKASALNLGYNHSHGEILMFVDADGIFTRSTIDEMLALFTSDKVGAICGNDAPVNLDRPLTQLMCLQTHVGTGFVRRALAQINCLPIVSGNIGAFRRSVLEKTDPADGIPLRQDIAQVWEVKSNGPFRSGFIGEDLELTWRVHKAGYQVKFAPHAVVLAEVPSTVKSLWKQRVRWARGLLQTVGLHRDMFFNFKYGRLGLYLPINFFNMVIIPILQLLILSLFILLVAMGYSPIAFDFLGIILWIGLFGVLFVTIFSIALDKAWKDLKYLYVIPLWAPYSVMMSMVTVWAIILELRGTEAQWNKFERTGVISRRSMSGDNKKEK
jgi:cellulose synthase/poly-beta-1,6-N-acetylglucosamine synthase-like glycosyltransferase